MDIVSHVVFAWLLNGGEMTFWLLLGSMAPDFDKIFTYTKRNFRGYRSRTSWTELPVAALLIAGSVFVHPHLTLGLISHYVLDFLVGQSRPFHPLVGNMVDFNLPLKHKMVIGAVLWMVGGVLYITRGIGL